MLQEARSGNNQSPHYILPASMCILYVSVEACVCVCVCVRVELDGVDILCLTVSSAELTLTLLEGPQPSCGCPGA